jgi:hypothetical protein
MMPMTFLRIVAERQGRGEEIHTSVLHDIPGCVVASKILRHM